MWDFARKNWKTNIAFQGGRTTSPVNRAYLSLGSNIEAERNLPNAVGELARYGRILAASRVWESPALGSHSANAANFLNAAVLLQTDLSAEAVCDVVVSMIEQRLGRVRDPNDKNASRTIDVDLSLFNEEIRTIGHHTIPDPEILARGFVAVPLAEVDPEYVHPVVKRRLKEIADELASGQRLWPRGDVSIGFNSFGMESSR
jgi:2-amino-4-hydroxy-6-hydroxymethyldihydropteridine diphosphokinase